MVKRYPINAPLRKLGFLPKFDLDTTTAENKALRGIYSFVATASMADIESITRQIKAVKNKQCRAELGHMMMEELGLESHLINGKCKLPSDMGGEGAPFDSVWIMMNSKTNYFFDPNYAALISQADNIVTRADLAKADQSLMNLPPEIINFTHWSLNRKWTQMLLDRGFDAISLKTYEENRSLTFNSLHHQVIPAGLVRRHLRIREPGKVKLPVRCFKSMTAAKGTFSSDLPLTKLPKVTFNKEKSEFELDVLNEGNAIFIVYVGDTQNGRCFEYDIQIKFVEEDELIRNMAGDDPLKIVENIYNYVTKRDLAELTKLLDLDLSSGKYAAAFNYLCVQNKIKCRVVYGVTKMRQSYLPDYDFTLEIHANTSAIRDSWNIVNINDRGYLIDCERGHSYDPHFKPNHRPFFNAAPSQFFASHYPECISPQTTLLDDNVTDVELSVWQRCPFRVPVYYCLGLNAENLFTEQQWILVRPGQTETLEFTYSSKYIGQVQFKTEVALITSEAASGCHRYQAVPVDKARINLYHEDSTLGSIQINLQVNMKGRFRLDLKGFHSEWMTGPDFTSLTTYVIESK